MSQESDNEEEHEPIPERMPMPEQIPERPIECTECRRPIAVQYTEIVNGVITQTIMCSECPVLRHKLYGIPHSEQLEKTGSGSLACGNCGTTLDAIRVGTPLGCDVCYEVFDAVLIPEMLMGHKIPPRVATNKKSAPVHIGRSPGETQEINPSLRLIALNESLNEVLKSEDYEQAAWLRDQIKDLTEKQKQANNEKK